MPIANDVEVFKKLKTQAGIVNDKIKELKIKQSMIEKEVEEGLSELCVKDKSELESLLIKSENDLASLVKEVDSYVKENMGKISKIEEMLVG